MLKIDIAVAINRSRRKWTNKKMLWSDLASELLTTTRTKETLREYLAASKKVQSDIKDIGGFVGGYLNDGVRAKSSVRHRQLVTLDIDQCKIPMEELLEQVLDKVPYELVIYSTHKHKNEAPRIRLVIPLDRPVSPDEYEAIARSIAGELNIDLFDPTTFQPSRMMFWPSTSSDGDFFSYHEEFAQLCSPDAILDTYVDWRDISAWPRLSTEDIAIIQESKSAGDPREKDGLVGAFCRAYTTVEAIEAFLENVYEYDGRGRYTYLDGSSASGGIPYNGDLFFYSHHSTDPVGQKLVNAFDLVRIHRFGGLDVDPNKPMSKLESFSAMCKLAMNDRRTKAELLSVDRPLSEALYTDFADDLNGEDTDWLGGDLPDNLDDLFGQDVSVVQDTTPEFYWPEPLDSIGSITVDNWEDSLVVTKKGVVESTISNLKLIILFDQDLRGKISFNEFDNCIYVKGPLPWDSSSKPRLWEDKDESGLLELIETKYGVYNISKTRNAIGLVALVNRHHPVKKFLESVEWDGVPRIDTLLIDHMGAEDSPFVRNATRKALTAAVARVFKPGCKFDYVLTLVGEEGLRKSALLEELGGAWFSDSFQTVEGSKAYEQLQGSWIMEIPELAAFNRAETNSIKAFVTKRKDKYRPAYHMVTLNLPRQCVFFATTNDFDFLRGYTGNRRFWPIEVTRKFQTQSVATMASNGAERIIGLPVNQIWAEAVHYFKAGETLYLSEDVEVKAKEKQEAFTEQHSWESSVLEYLETEVPVNWEEMTKFERKSFFNEPSMYAGVATKKQDFICARAIAEEYLSIPPKDISTGKLREICAILNKNKDWYRRESRRHFSGYGSTRYYERKESSEWLKNT